MDLKINEFFTHHCHSFFYAHWLISAFSVAAQGEPMHLSTR